MTDKEWLESQLAGMNGSTVLDAAVLEDGDLLIPAILFRRPDGRIFQMEIIGDPEGNFSAHIETHEASP